MKNQEVAALLYEIADIFELKGVEWKPRAYRRAAQAIDSISEAIEEDIYKEKWFDEIGNLLTQTLQK